MILFITVSLVNALLNVFRQMKLINGNKIIAGLAAFAFFGFNAWALYLIARYDSMDLVTKMIISGGCNAVATVIVKIMED